jgi:hypothetical protein
MNDEDVRQIDECIHHYDNLTVVVWEMMRLTNIFVILTK